NTSATAAPRPVRSESPYSATGTSGTVGGTAPAVPTISAANIEAIPPVMSSFFNMEKLLVWDRRRPSLRPCGHWSSEEALHPSDEAEKDGPEEDEQEPEHETGRERRVGELGDHVQNRKARTNIGAMRRTSVSPASNQTPYQVRSRRVWSP